jgi:hypothetical protein
VFARDEPTLRALGAAGQQFEANSPQMRAATERLLELHLDTDEPGLPLQYLKPDAITCTTASTGQRGQIAVRVPSCSEFHSATSSLMNAALQNTQSRVVPTDGAMEIQRVGARDAADGLSDGAGSRRAASGVSASQTVAVAVRLSCSLPSFEDHRHLAPRHGQQHGREHARGDFQVSRRDQRAGECAAGGLKLGRSSRILFNRFRLKK